MGCSFTLRIANKSTPSECLNNDFSQTECGFVLEFTDIITLQEIDYKEQNVGGWPASIMRIFINSYIYNALPKILKDNIIDTKVISGYGKNDANGTGPEGNWISTDKQYLLVPNIELLFINNSFFLS